MTSPRNLSKIAALSIFLVATTAQAQNSNPTEDATLTPNQIEGLQQCEDEGSACWQVCEVQNCVQSGQPGYAASTWGMPSCIEHMLVQCNVRCDQTRDECLEDVRSW